MNEVSAPSITITIQLYEQPGAPPISSNYEILMPVCLHYASLVALLTKYLFNNNIAYETLPIPNGTFENKVHIYKNQIDKLVGSIPNSVEIQRLWHETKQGEDHFDKMYALLRKKPLKIKKFPETDQKTPLKSEDSTILLSYLKSMIVSENYTEVRSLAEKPVFLKLPAEYIQDIYDLLEGKNQNDLRDYVLGRMVESFKD